MAKVPLDVLAEGGFVNDASGDATKKLRATIKGKVVDTPPSAYEKSRRGNPTLRKFK